MNTNTLDNIITGIIAGILLIIFIAGVLNDINYYGNRQGTIIDKKYYIKIQKEQKSTWIEIPEEKYFNLKIGDDYNENT